MNTKRSVICCRTATPSEVVIQVQHDACLELCQRYNLDVVGTLVEAVRGRTLDDRPKRDELRQMMRKRHIDVVVVYAVNRLARDYEVLLTLAYEAEANGVEIHSATEVIAGKLAPLKINAMLIEREQLAILLRDAHHKERRR